MQTPDFYEIGPKSWFSGKTRKSGVSRKSGFQNGGLGKHFRQKWWKTGFLIRKNEGKNFCPKIVGPSLVGLSKKSWFGAAQTVYKTDFFG